MVVKLKTLILSLIIAAAICGFNFFYKSNKHNR